MKSIGLNRSFLISFILHLVFVLIMSLTIKDNPFNKMSQPIMVNIDIPSETIASGLNEVLNQPVSKSFQKPQKRVTSPVEKKPHEKVVVPEKPVKKKEEVKKEIKEEIVKKEEVKDSKALHKELIEEVKTPKEEAKAPVVEEVMDKDFVEKLEEDFVDKEIDKISENIDNILDADEPTKEEVAPLPGEVGRSDPLSDVEWNSKPRKTLFFPDIESKIPQEYRTKGKGYSVTVKMAFDPNGLAIKVEIIESSGDSKIDSIFSTELRKVRVESISGQGIDEVTKTFTISVK